MGTKQYILNPDRQYVIGTAGHIDHGKTALVKALTGVDTDRLPEEKERGITIDLGFAHLSNNVTIIDVPGHERLIKNMVSGVSTIDLVLFVIAADDGVMPQTREHLDIINLLGIRHGIFVITKIDLVDEEWLALVEEDVENLVQQTN
ncbi:MAG: GTP-binding protein [Calditrichia bacterium]